MLVLEGSLGLGQWLGAGAGLTEWSHSPCSRPPAPPRFLYSDEVQIGPETVMTTLYTAKKYAVPALEAHCVEFLKKNLRADNAFMLLTQVRRGRGRQAGCAALSPRVPQVLRQGEGPTPALAPVSERPRRLVCDPWL